MAKEAFLSCIKGIDINLCSDNRIENINKEQEAEDTQIRNLRCSVDNHKNNPIVEGTTTLDKRYANIATKVLQVIHQILPQIFSFSLSRSSSTSSVNSENPASAATGAAPSNDGL